MVLASGEDGSCLPLEVSQPIEKDKQEKTQYLLERIHLMWFGESLKILQEKLENAAG